MSVWVKSWKESHVRPIKGPFSLVSLSISQLYSHIETLPQYVRNDQPPKKVGFFLFHFYSKSFTSVLIYYWGGLLEDKPILLYSDSPCSYPWQGAYLKFHLEGKAASCAPTAAVLHLKPKGEIDIAEIFCNLKVFVELPKQHKWLLLIYFHQLSRNSDF